MTPPNPGSSGKPVKIIPARPAKNSGAGQEERAALHDPEKALRSALDIMQKLTALLEREQELISKKMIAEHAELLKAKQRLALDYHAQLQIFAVSPGLLKKAPDALRREAREAAEKLSVTTQRNAQGLRATIVAIQKFTQTIVSLVKKETLPPQGYGSLKPHASTIGHYSPSCTPVVVRRNA